jgi:rod shape-determining protein MreD
MLTSYRLSFLISFLSLLIIPIYFPSLHLLFFAPTLIISLYRKRLLLTFWHALFCGLICDLFSSSTYFGTTSLGFALIVAILSRFKRYFFDDSLTTLPIMTFFFGLLYPFVHWVMHLFFPSFSFFSWRFLLTDVFLMSLADTLYAFLLFSLPLQLYNKIGKARRRVEE